MTVFFYASKTNNIPLARIVLNAKMTLSTILGRRLLLCFLSSDLDLGLTSKVKSVKQFAGPRKPRLEKGMAECELIAAGKYQLDYKLGKAFCVHLPHQPLTGRPVSSSRQTN